MNKTAKTVIGIIGIALLVLIVWYFRTLISYVLVAAVLSFMGAPLVRLLKRIQIGKRHLPSWLAATVTLTTFVFIIVIFFRILAPLIAEEATKIAQLDLNNTTADIEGSINKTEAWLDQFNISGDERSNQDFLLSQIKSFIDFSQLSSAFNNIFSILGNAFIAVFSVLFIAFFFLKDSTMLVRIVMTVTPDKHLDAVKQIMETSNELLIRYFLGVLLQIGITATILTIGLSIVGVENALLIGVIAGTFNLIPYLGPIIGALLGLLIAITTNLTLGADA
ncbi:MAG: AI-2E family transporter, partial [Flavobacteriales bacterium]|nr:AI-2E family transporter [Flavobacteriales bacterium]